MVCRDKQMKKSTAIQQPALIFYDVWQKAAFNLLGPFNIKNKMIISKSWHSCDSSGGVLPTVETDEGKTLQETKKEKENNE